MFPEAPLFEVAIVAVAAAAAVAAVLVLAAFKSVDDIVETSSPKPFVIMFFVDISIIVAVFAVAVVVEVVVTTAKNANNTVHMK